jgi:DNA-binding Lrp family transcriptional regulator
MTELDDLDRTLLERLQDSFPLVPRPFAALAQSVSLDEAGALARIRRLKAEGFMRQISGIFDTRRLGYQSTLVAFHVLDEELEDVAAQISGHPGVSHNYARPHRYNLWFTLAVPPAQDLPDEIRRLARQSGVDDWLDLPALKTFKIKTHFVVGNSDSVPATAQVSRTTEGQCPFVPEDIPFVQVLQEDLPLVPRPFAAGAEKLGVSEGELLERARELQAAGIMRRFGAVLRHRRVGYTANGMACWAVPEAQIEDMGRRAAEFSQVSHCYQRPAHPPRWPYTLFTMIHGQSRDQVEAVVEQIARETGIAKYEILYSTREFKKERVKYFTG